MSEFNNVTVIKEANVYFDGGVTSRTIFFADGSRKTLGIMMPGEYTFNTGSAELMEIMSGEMTVLLPGSPDWVPVRGGEAFEVPENSSFKLKVTAVADYCCSFL
ncbi:pyrimidine/purine nucleoside phosphorylase [Geomonas azotofigens]|uniref:pyrimidine/purine nucleoside phosphorylase n=1 Tax=Geomonas azotofigens TaxID=2843196 RepID=UPI001C0F7675|nr:pyrimidine/purine nucleoside phosphorylase [Geomonas azotofigens]MBU5613059.1 pyrimidine/purine nucleoside phosphorylase [Geomonas azotofigens]